MTLKKKLEISVIRVQRPELYIIFTTVDKPINSKCVFKLNYNMSARLYITLVLYKF